ncbi:MAG: hypothetical protein PHH41_06835 [Sulfurimonas sp.]|nr:hypothetical protein [Sulfurimonas sp.]MDD5202842.1 hypothetical protein [Sulfurimonas sp.]
MKKVILGILVMHMVLFGSDLLVDGNVLSTSKIVSYEDIYGMKKLEIKSVPMVCKNGDVKDKASDYDGVLLRQIIDALPIEIKERHDYNSIVITVIAADNYQVTFTYNELFNTKVGDGVLLSYAKNSKALGDKELALISANDLKTGPRHVKNVKEIQVNMTKYEVKNDTQK